VQPVATITMLIVTLGNPERIVEVLLRELSGDIGTIPCPAVGIGDRLRRGKGRHVRLDAVRGILSPEVHRPGLAMGYGN
jgi:hypothetical protein